MTEGLKIYAVGGAVRDRLLGLPVTERDWVVVGSSPEEMLARGFQPVGKDFPVFLHPDTHEEYALARTEQKVAPGYHGFTFHADASVTLEQDLQRRDLTINAIAETAQGQLIDPWGGQADLAARQLRHVSPAFREDPVRILRLARFAARFADLGFHIAKDTLALCQRMVAEHEADALVPERVWQEMAKALMTSRPDIFVEALKDSHLLPVILPALDIEKDELGLVCAALREAAASNAALAARFAVLLHRIDDDVAKVCDRLRAPRSCRDLAVLVHEHYRKYQQLASLNAEAVVELLVSLDAYRRPDRLADFTDACQAITRAQSTNANADTDELERALAITQDIAVQPLVDRGLRGPDIAKAIHAERVYRLQQRRSR
ncbi:multifunctional CCA tRNA nucleotidyl transferase/2'3'-cyclic phosphodiesterase/2'nucleotidase/phosphatase [Spiribacter sp. C176]|uniref:CCA-adding enzyme n=1 Tax=Spiribacter salilacus TaxID=2664894 RepID=A0A6N7QQI6_9GAMM|nr:multifunctional CCA tRNA nucleotidyl transferase/2'3'-cyclic phosphodiesterase/2'nucleotidase/phosphatase [Spiribacter salilacus]